VIFVTTGTAEPFDRLVRAADALAAHEEVVIQYGHSNLLPQRARGVAFMPFDELVELIRAARVVVSAAGVGTVMTILSCGKMPIVVPRLQQHGEAIDDHQLPFARRVAAAGLITIEEDESRLPAVVATYDVAARPTATAGGGGLAAELRNYLEELLGEPNRPTSARNGVRAATGRAAARTRV